MEYKFETWPIDNLIEYARNPRKNDHAVDKVAAAIREFGFRVPIVAKSDGTVVDGHLRLKAAKKLKLKEIPVILADDLTDAQIKAFRISVNKVAELADWDDDLLKLELQELDDDGFNLELIGFDLDELTKLFDDPNFDAGSEDDQGKLDQLDPKIVTCPHCAQEFDLREHGEG
jgi:ParB-like chromosome segregation protein Spo0J